jgi:5-methyltetrahydrofolate--homocysteine methyltransferase
MKEDLVNLLANLKEAEALQLTEERLENNENPMAILGDTRRGMEIVGERFANGTYFLPDLIFSGEILKGISAILKPKLTGTTEIKRIGKIVLGTVAGDIHDIGLNIVDFMLDVNGFEVYNLGVDLPAQVFIDKIIESDARIVGLSGFLTLAFDSMKETIAAITEAGLRDRVKIMIGGGQIDDEVRKYTGADAFGRDAIAAVSFAKVWAQGV